MANTTGFVRDPLGIVDGFFRTATDALLVAIAELKREGGGTVWIHRGTCELFIDNDDCPCYPIPLPVDPDDPN